MKSAYTLGKRVRRIDFILLQAPVRVIIVILHLRCGWPGWHTLALSFRWALCLWSQLVARMGDEVQRLIALVDSIRNSQLLNVDSLGQDGLRYVAPL